MQMRENLMPLVDAAEGFRKILEDRGWPRHVADVISGEMLHATVRFVFDDLKRINDARKN